MIRALLVAVALLTVGYTDDNVGPYFFFRDPAFDQDKTLWEGEPVRAEINRLLNGSTGERESATLAMSHIHHGCEHHTMHSGETGPDRSTRLAMILGLRTSYAGPRAKVVVPALTKALDDPIAEVRRMAVRSLMMIGPEAADACDKLRLKLDDSQPTVRAWAASALYEIQLEVTAPLATNLRLLGDADADVRIMGACNLGLMGEDARSAIDALEESLEDPVEDVRTEARWALNYIRSTGIEDVSWYWLAIPALLLMLLSLPRPSEVRDRGRVRRNIFTTVALVAFVTLAIRSFLMGNAEYLVPTEENLSLSRWLAVSGSVSFVPVVLLSMASHNSLFAVRDRWLVMSATAVLFSMTLSYRLGGDLDVERLAHGASSTLGLVPPMSYVWIAIAVTATVALVIAGARRRLMPAKEDEDELESVEETGTAL